MKTIKPQKLGVLCRTFVHDDRAYLTVSVLVCSPFDTPRALLTEAALWKLVEEELGAENNLLDEGHSKMQGEVLVNGKCFVPGGAPLPASVSYARVQIGTVDKRLAVFGDRQWRHGVPTAPEPFLEMPLDWAHAFGGDGFAQNPLGKGYGAKANVMPNVEDPKNLVVAPRDRPSPAGFGAWDFTWPQRSSLVGTYDDKWLRTRFPGYAADLDPSIFNVAPKDQRIEGYFKGNETFVVENMHPTKTRLTGALPGAVVRVFIQQRGEVATDPGPPVTTGAPPPNPRSGLREIAMRIDTVRLIPHRERAVIVYRGVVPIREDDAFDVTHLLLACEDPSEPKPVSHYEAVLASRLDRDRGALLVLKDEDLMPPAALGWVPRAEKSDVARMVAKEDLFAKNLRRKQANEMAKGREKILAMGLDPADFNLAAPPPEEPEIDPDDLDAAILRMDQSEQDATRQVEELEAKKAEMVAEARAAFAAQGQDYDAAIEQARRDTAGPPKFRAHEQLEWLRGTLRIAREGNAPLLELEAKAEDPAYFAELQSQERQLVESYRKGAHYQHPVEPRGPEGSELSRVEIEAAHHNGIGLPDRDFTGADLSKLVLPGIDLSGAFLESVDLTGADLSGANLTGAVLAHAKLVGTRFTGAKLDGANLGGATLDGADLSDAQLEGTILARATIKATSLQRARLRRVDFLEAKLEGGADFSGVTAVELLFFGVDLRGARFTGADLTKCVFAECKVGGADFSGANLTRASFVTTNADGANFRGATLDGCRFISDSSLVDADLSEASAQRSLFRGVPMTRAKLPGLRADTADFSECDLVEADLHRIVAKNALFMRTDLSLANVAGADLLGAILQKAKLHGTDLRGANLFRADLVKVRVDGATKIGEANMKQARVYPRADDGSR